MGYLTATEAENEKIELMQEKGIFHLNHTTPLKLCWKMSYLDWFGVKLGKKNKDE